MRYDKIERVGGYGQGHLFGILVFAFLLLLSAPPTFADFTIYRSFQYSSRTHDSSFRMTGNLSLFVSSLGIRAELSYDRDLKDYPDEYVVIVNYDRQMAWMVKPDMNKFHWVDYKQIRKNFLKSNRRIAEKLTPLEPDSLARPPESSKKGSSDYWWKVENLSPVKIVGVQCSTSRLSLYSIWEAKRKDSVAVLWTAQTSKDTPLLDSVMAYVSLLEDSILLGSCLNCQYARVNDTGRYSLVANLFSLLLSDSLNQPVLNFQAVRQYGRIQPEFVDAKGKTHTEANWYESETVYRILSYNFDPLPASLFDQPKGMTRRQPSEGDLPLLLAMLLQ